MSKLGSSTARWWRRITLLDALVFTTPLLALVLWLFAGAVLDYRRIRQFDDWWSRATSVRKFGYYRVRTALRSFEMNELAKGFSAEREDKPLLRIVVDRDKFKALESDVAAHWGEWIDVELVDAGDRTPARLRFRGDGSAHWTSEKKSFTLRTSRDELYKGFRSLAFSVKDVLPQWLVGTIAKDFGLLAPEQQIVPVYLNERFYGLHRFVEPVDESFLRRNLRMPGNIFRADTAERGDYFKGLLREVFANPHIWERVANNDRPGAFGTALLEQFLRDLNDTSDAGRERFMSWLDTTELSRLLAFLLVCGDPYHMSGVHNQFWYEDPTSGKLHPIVWDVRLLDLDKPPTGSNINRFWRAALEDPRVWDGAMREVAKWLEGDKLYKLAEQRVNEAWRKYEAEFEYDTLRAGVIPPVGDPKTTLATLRKNLDTLRAWASDARCETSSVYQDDGSLMGPVVLDCVVSGRAPVAVRLIGNMAEPGPYIYEDSDEDGRLGPTDRLLGRTWEGVTLWPGVGGAGAALEPAALHYRLFLKMDENGPALSEVTPSPVNALTREAVASTRLAGLAPLPARAPARTQGDVPDSSPVRLAQARFLKRDQLTAPGQTLIIEAGTTLTLAPDVSILAKGRVLAIGTAEQPITITASDPLLPWGVFALQGEGANGSRFEHVKFERGGGGQLERVEYKGMVCVHNARDVTFDHCEFSHNQRCDDAINIVKSDASITNSFFHDTNADSIDYDMSSGLVAFNRIERSGNDGLDLMTCWPRVVSNTILDSGDKGLSVGEESRPLVLNNTILRCQKGMEIKDRSAPMIVHTLIEGGPVGIDANKKNWRYGEAGWPTIVRSSIDALDRAFVVRDGARHTIADARMGGVEIAPGADLRWLFAQYGFEPHSDAIGLAPSLELSSPRPPLHELRFQEDFVSPTDGWTFSGGVTRLVKRGAALVATARARAGSVARAVDWDLSDPTLEFALVVEAAGDSLRSAHVLAVGVGHESASKDQLTLAPSPDSYRFTALTPPRARLERIELALSPEVVGRLRVRSVRVVAWPRSDH